MAETWIKLAAEIAADGVLLRTLSQLEFAEPEDALRGRIGQHRGIAP
jgi:hypothetical protein